MAQHVMLDLETLHVRLDCVILTIGACVFDPRGDGIVERFYIKPDVDEQIALGKTLDEGTVDWWARQNQQARDEAFSEHDRVPYLEALEQLTKFCWNKDRVWSNGATFDISIIEYSLRECNIAQPWNFWDVRDTRTIYEIAGVNLRDGGFVTSHRADDDAIRQAVKVQESYKKLMQAGFLLR